MLASRRNCGLGSLRPRSLRSTRQARGSRKARGLSALGQFTAALRGGVPWRSMRTASPLFSSLISSLVVYPAVLSSVITSQQLNIDIQDRRRAANDKTGTLNYEKPLQSIIVQQMKTIDQIMSGILTGSNIDMSENNQVAMSDTIHQASSFPVDSNTYTPHQYNSM